MDENSLLGLTSSYRAAILEAITSALQLTVMA